MKMIISGGTGLIGSALAASLARDGHQAIVLSRDPQAHTSQPPASGVQIVHWDGRTAEGWGHLVDGAGAVINLAGESIAGDSLTALIFKRWTSERRGRLLTSRVDAGHAMLEAIQQAQIKPAVFVQASAVGYYGSRGDEELTEDTGVGDDFLARICTAWEASTAPLEKLGVRRVIVRSSGVVMSLAGGAFPFMLLPFKLFVGGPLGGGKQWFSWIHIQDEVKAIRFLIDNPQASGVFNLVAPQATTNAEFSKVLGKVMGRPSWFPVPALALKLLFGAKAAILLGSTRQVPKRLQELGFVFDFPTAETAIADILKKAV
jgi:uncharacterized protein (TIGR01777 family)